MYDILIFRTSVSTKEDLAKIKALFAQEPRIQQWNVDLQDWEKVLRIESMGCPAQQIIQQLLKIGIIASELE